MDSNTTETDKPIDEVYQPTYKRKVTRYETVGAYPSGDGNYMVPITGPVLVEEDALVSEILIF